MPKISVIVPVYKVEKYIHKCVDSILNQTFSDIEVILVDDGTPDRCGEICDAYGEQDSRVKVIHKENGGLSDARNAGMPHASGEYIIFTVVRQSLLLNYATSTRTGKRLFLLQLAGSFKEIAYTVLICNG